MQYTVLIVAAGSGSRMGLGYNKMLYPLAEGMTVIEKTVSVFRQDTRCAQIIVACAMEDRDQFEQLCGKDDVDYVIGGATRQESVYHGLREVSQEWVLIHDGARPWLSLECIDRLLETLRNHKACLLCTPVKDTIKEVENGYIKQTYKRDKLYAAQTPQAFHTELIRCCYEQAMKEHITATDDAQLVEMYSDVPICVVEGSYANTKVTTPEDIVGK